MTGLDLVLDTVARGAADLEIADAITGGDLERTIEGASTLTLELHDPHRKVIRHKALTRAIDFEFDNTWWRLVKVSKSGDAVTLTFEDRDVAYLRRHNGPRKVNRKVSTRAQFVRTLVREVGKRKATGKQSDFVAKRRIRFYCPEVNERQPIGGDTGPGVAGGTTVNAVLHVGDSLAVGTIPPEDKRLGARVDGDGLVGRTSSQTLTVLQAKLKPRHDVVIFDAGTNDDPAATTNLRNNLRDAKTACGKRRMIVATLNRGNADVSALNTVIRDFAHDTAGVLLVDWAKKGDKYLGGDGTHPTTAGYKYRAGLFASAVGRVGSGGAKAGKVTRRTKATRDTKRQPGIADDARLTVKGARADRDQRKNGQRVLDVADQLNAGPKATKALMEAVIVESMVRNLSGGDRDSQGVLQVRVSTSGSSARSRDIEWCCKEFLLHGFYNDPVMGAGGAIAKARKFPQASAGRVAQAVQGSGVPGAYDTVADEAAEWIAAYGGSSGTDTGGVTTDRPGRRRYEFSRGQPGQREDSWTCIQRLASEVNWRAFMDRGTLYFISEDRLRKSAARYIVTEDTDGINELDFDLDHGKVESELRMSCRTDLFDIRVGSVVIVRELGVANGRYLVSNVRRGLFDADTEVMLKRPTPKLPEPLAEEKAVSGGTRAGQGVQLTTGGKGGLRDRIVAVAKASADSYRRSPGSWFYSQAGAWNVDDPTRPPRRGNRSDCSQWVAAVYKKAGAPPPAPDWSNAWTGNMRVKGRQVPLSQAIPGDIIWWSSHVELYVGPGSKTIGHGSPPVDPGTWNIKPGAICWRYNFLD